MKGFDKMESRIENGERILVVRMCELFSLKGDRWESYFVLGRMPINNIVVVTITIATGYTTSPIFLENT
jgi:hypothetical protein